MIGIYTRTDSDSEPFINATDLLLECLDVAYVSDREAIEERLLRPPAGG